MSIIPIFLPHAGCKRRCVFCNEYSATGLRRVPTRNEIFHEVDRYLAYFADKESVELAFYGGTFTGLPEELMRDYLDLAMEVINSGKAKAIRFSTSPEEITQRKVEILSRYPVSLVEIGAQSFDEEILRLANRPHGVEDIYRACDFLKEADISFGIHLMTGLPGDCEEKDIKSAIEVVKLNASTCRIHPTVVLKSSTLERMYFEGKYKPQELDEALSILWKMYVILACGGVNINRIGICLYGDEVNNVVAGPYHPALGELVKNRVALEILRVLKRRWGDRIILKVNEETKQFFTGHKKYVLNRAKEEGLKVIFERVSAPELNLRELMKTALVESLDESFRSEVSGILQVY